MADGIPYKMLATFAGVGLLGGMLAALCADRMSWREIAQALACGVFMAVTATPAIVDFFQLDPAIYSLPTAALLGITGRRMVIKAAAAPIRTLREILAIW